LTLKENFNSKIIIEKINKTLNQTMNEKFRIDLKNDSTTSSLFSNKDSVDTYTQIVSNSINAFQNKRRQEWMRNEPIDIMSQSNPSEIRSSSPSMDSLGFNDELHDNQNKSNPNDSIYKGNDCTSNKQFCNTPLTNNENFRLPSATSSTKQNSTSSNLKEINSLQCPYYKQRQVHINNNDYQLNKINNKNEILFPHDLSSKQYNSNFKRKKNVNITNHCDSSPQFYMTPFHDFIVMQQNLCNKKLNDSSNNSIFSTQDCEYYNIEKSQNIVPCFKSQHNESLQSVPWSNIYPFLNPRLRYVHRDDVHTIEKLPQTKPKTRSKMIPNFCLDQSSKVKNPFHNLSNKNLSNNPKFVNNIDHSLANNERKVTFSMQNVRYVRTSTQYNQSDLNGRQNFSEPSNQIEESYYSNANDHSQINNPTNLEIDDISENNYIQENNYNPENNYTLENNNNIENNYTLDTNYTLRNSYTPENTYIPESNNILENNYTLDNNYSLENNYNPEIIDGFERTETETFCELGSIPPYSKRFSSEITVPSNSYVPPVHGESNLESFDTTSLENNRYDVPIYTEYQYNSSTNPSISSDNFQHPLNDSTVNCNRNEFYDDAIENNRNDPCAYNETIDYYNGRNSDHLEVNGYNNLCVYNESGGYNNRDSDQINDKETYNENLDLGDRDFDKYEVNEDNQQYYDESASCSGSDRSVDRFEIGQVDNNLENNRRSFVSFDNDNSPKSFPATASQRSIVGTIELPEELALQEDLQIELIRSTDYMPELEKMKIGQRESTKELADSACGGLIQELQGEVEEMVLGSERQESLTTLQNEMKLRSQNEIKESLRDELEDELKVGLEEVLNLDIQGMEDSIMQLLAKSEVETESLDQRVKAERNRGEISSKPPPEMEGYKKRREEHERIREEKRQKLLGSLSAMVDGNPRQPTTYSTCNFCNLEYSEGIEIEMGDLKPTIVTNKEILELIQRNESESKSLLQRIQNTLKASANPIVYNDQILDPLITSML